MRNAEMLKSAADWREYEGDQDPIEVELIRNVARCYNRFDFSGLADHLAEDVVYESQLSFDPVIGKHAVMAHLQENMRRAAEDLPKQDIYADVGFCGPQKGRVSVWGMTGRPCVVISSCYGCPPIGLVFVEREGRLISRLDVCVVVPHPSSAIRTGEYPE